MKRKYAGRYPGPAGMFTLSLACHLAVLLIIVKSQFFPEFRPDETLITYVDMVTLPVESPRSGTPAPEAETAEPEPPRPVAVAPPPPPAAMSQPTKPAPVKPATPAKTQTQTQAAAQEKAEQPAPAAEANDFKERLAKLERIAEDKRQAEVLDRLRKKGTQTGTQTGMPGAKGDEAGSDYPSYLQSRLKDALRQVMVSQSKSPELFATITVAPDGRITEYRVEKVSGDPLFEDAVKRAVTLAGKSLVPPPGGAQFKHGFRFRPEEVGIR